VGILDCLQKYQEELSGDCKDAFLATSKATVAGTVGNLGTSSSYGRGLAEVASSFGCLCQILPRRKHHSEVASCAFQWCCQHCILCQVIQSLNSAVQAGEFARIETVPSDVKWLCDIMYYCDILPMDPAVPS
jgi:hypothetical protein